MVLASAIFQISETSFSYQINVMNVKKIISIDLHKGIEGINGPVVLNFISILIKIMRNQSSI